MTEAILPKKKKNNGSYEMLYYSIGQGHIFKSRVPPKNIIYKDLVKKNIIYVVNSMKKSHQ